MRRLALLLLALVVTATAVVAVRSCDSAPDVPRSGPGSQKPGVDGRERRRGAAAAELPETIAQAAVAEEDDVAAPEEPVTRVNGRDPELALPLRRLSGIVVDEAGDPVAGASVGLVSRWLSAEVACLASPVGLAARTPYSSPDGGAPHVISIASTPADGRFRLQYVVGDQLRVRVCAGLRRHEAPVADPSQELHIVLADRPVAVRVHVTRAADGSSVEGARVTLASPQLRQAAATDAAGLATFKTGDTGELRVSVMAAGLETIEERAVEVGAGTPAVVRIGLLPEDRVQGHVVDAETGRPVPGARIGPGVARWWTVLPPTTTDDLGRFDLRGLPFEEHVSRPICVVADGYVPLAAWLPWEERHVAVREIELALVRGGAVRVRCVDASGSPQRDVLVHASGSRKRAGPGDRRDVGDGACWTDADGVATTPDLPSGEEPVRVRIFLHGVEVVRREAPAPASGEQVDLGDVVVVAGGTLSGSVQTADGGAAAGVTVIVVPDDPADEHLSGLGDAALDPNDERHGISDADGRFEILGLAGGTWHVLAWTPDGPHAPQLVRGVVMPASRDAPPLAIRLPRPAVIRGVVLDPDDNPLVGVEVGALRDAPVPMNLMQCTVTDERGSFRLPGVFAIGERVWVEVDNGDQAGELITVGTAPLELHFDRLVDFDPDEYDRAMGR